MERCCGAEVWSWVSKMCRINAAVALSTWSHHKHQCRLLWGSAQVERSMGGGSAGPASTLGGEWSGVAGLRYGLGCPKCAQCLRQAMLR